MALSAGAANRSPFPCFRRPEAVPTGVCLSAVCRARDRVPSGRVTPSRAQQVKAAQVEERSGRGALVLALMLCYTGDPAREVRYGT